MLKTYAFKHCSIFPTKTSIPDGAVKCNKPAEGGLSAAVAGSRSWTVFCWVSWMRVRNSSSPISSENSVDANSSTTVVEVSEWTFTKKREYMGPHWRRLNTFNTTVCLYYLADWRKTFRNIWNLCSGFIHRFSAFSGWSNLTKNNRQTVKHTGRSIQADG